MKRSDQERLFNEILADEELAAFRRASLQRGLTAMRRRKSQRSALLICALATLPLIAVLTVLLRWNSQNSGQRMTVSNTTWEATTAPPRQIAKVRFISDEELFALFPGRSLALIGKPGEQQLVFLDKN